MNQRFFTLLSLTIILSISWIDSAPASQLNVISQLTSQRGEPPNPSSGGRGDSNGGSRSPICVVSPGEQGNSIWSDRPLFLWTTQQTGIVGRIAVRNLSTQEVVWSQDLTDTTQHILYNGRALQPGEYYQWVLSSDTGESVPVDWNTAFLFKVMTPSQRDSITAALQQIEDQLTASHASLETIALQQAQYLQTQNLSPDALQILYSVLSPSTTVTQTIQQISSELCSTEVDSPGATN